MNAVMQKTVIKTEELFTNRCRICAGCHEKNEFRIYRVRVRLSDVTFVFELYLARNIQI